MVQEDSKRGKEVGKSGSSHGRPRRSTDGEKRGMFSMGSFRAALFAVKMKSLRKKRKAKVDDNSLSIEDFRDEKDHRAVVEFRELLCASNLLPPAHDDYHALLRLVTTMLSSSMPLFGKLDRSRAQPEVWLKIRQVLELQITYCARDIAALRGAVFFGLGSTMWERLSRCGKTCYGGEKKIPSMQ